MLTTGTHVKTAVTDNTQRPAAQDISRYTIFSAGDVGAAHAMAHRMLDQGRIEEGHARLGAWLEGRSGSGSEWIHIQFHMAVFELELGLVDAAYDRFVENILPAAATTTEALTDAPALAWRLWLATGSPHLFPWEPIRATAAARIQMRDEPWVDLHNALALAGAGDLASLDLWLASRSRRAGSDQELLMIEVAETLRAYAAGDHVLAALGLGATVARIPEIGGSHAQNQLFSQIEEACWRRCSQRPSAVDDARAA